MTAAEQPNLSGPAGGFLVKFPQHKGVGPTVPKVFSHIYATAVRAT